MNNSIAEEVVEDCIGEGGSQVTVLPIYAAMIGIVHYSIGNDLTGFTITKWMRVFDRQYKNDHIVNADNCISLLSHLYSFHLIHCAVIFDLVRKFISSFKEIDVVLLLSLLRSSSSPTLYYYFTQILLVIHIYYLLLLFIIIIILLLLIKEELLTREG